MGHEARKHECYLRSPVDGCWLRLVVTPASWLDGATLALVERLELRQGAQRVEVGVFPNLLA
jgi:hypothetical protein